MFKLKVFIFSTFDLPCAPHIKAINIINILTKLLVLGFIPKLVSWNWVFYIEKSKPHFVHQIVFFIIRKIFIASSKQIDSPERLRHNYLYFKVVHYRDFGRYFSWNCSISNNSRYITSDNSLLPIQTCKWIDHRCKFFIWLNILLLFKTKAR